MRVTTIRLDSGILASVDESGLWKCDDLAALSILRSRFSDPPAGYHPEQSSAFAIAAADALGAEVLETKPAPKWDPETIY